ncbi:hypothetical protein [Mesorhizobium sp. KR9-304]|uniref:hypothetical protein n=1 Tax=Mesorhizobium sp. KR9-304 TaxID=3156614 RepID=UPI0032B54BF0
MGVLEDFNKMLDRIPIWKRLGEVPAEVDGLMKRVADLEAKLNNKWPGDVCRMCGARAARLTDTRGPTSQGIVHENWTCGECGETDYRHVKVR